MQDAHEFFCEVIDMVKEEIISLDKQSNSPDKPQSEGSTSTTPQQRVPRENSGNNSPVNASVDNFEFEVRRQLSIVLTTFVSVYEQASFRENKS